MIAATLSGTVNALGWLAVVIYGFGALGCGYFLTAQSNLSAA